MLTETLQNFSIPKKKNVIFVNPELSRWPELLTGNTIATKDIPNRSEFRKELIKIARNYTLGITDSCPKNIQENIIATGHQAIWHHCGIWAKNISTYKFAKVVHGNSVHLVLDHDICDTAMVLPKYYADRGWCSKKIDIELGQKNIPLEFRQLPPKLHIKAFIDKVVKAYPGQFCSDIWSECINLEDNKISYFDNIADLITYLQSVLNVILGLNMLYLPVSKFSESDAFLNFAISVILDADNFAAAYNDVVTRQIDEQKINRRNTVQHLKLNKTTGLTELPFWLFMPNGKRTSLYVGSPKKGTIKIGTNSTVFGNLDSACVDKKAEQLKTLFQKLNYRLRPKAVSLTLFTRLFLADWFVHGIGGVLYESVTNHMIENYYGIASLKYGVTTSTMTLPITNNLDFSGKDISQLKHELHSIKYNPEKHIDKSILKEESITSLLQAKRLAIVRAKDRSLSGAMRKVAWDSLFRINESLSKYTTQAVRTLERKIRELEKNKISHEVCDSREYFFGLFPEKKLRKLIESFTFSDKITNHFKTLFKP